MKQSRIAREEVRALPRRLDVHGSRRDVDRVDRIPQLAAEASLLPAVEPIELLLVLREDLAIKGLERGRHVSRQDQLIVTHQRKLRLGMQTRRVGIHDQESTLPWTDSDIVHMGTNTSSIQREKISPVWNPEG